MNNDQEDIDLSVFRRSLERFIDSEIAPFYEQWEKEHLFPREIWRQLGELGFLGVDIPEQYGGCGADFRFSMTVLEALSRANCASLCTSVAVHSDIVAHYILNHGTETQKQRYLPGMISGDCVGAVAMTEPGAGSDLQSICTSAKLDGDSFIINGCKTFITNGRHCDLIVIAARTRLDTNGAKGTTLFLVDADAKGFQRGRNLDKIGLHSGGTSELFFDNVRVPRSAVLGEIDSGFAVLMGELARERLTLAAAAVAAAEGLLTETISYVKERHAFGGPLSHFQNTKFTIAEMATDVSVHRAFVDECKRRFQIRKLDTATVSMAKLSATEMQNRIADRCLQLHGGYGYMREYGVARAYVDARVQKIYGGTSEIMKELIARDILN